MKFRIGEICKNIMDSHVKDVDIMGQIILKLVGVLILLAGVILIYDARIITKKVFGFGDQNEATSGFKILGVLLSIIGALIVYFC